MTSAEAILIQTGIEQGFYDEPVKVEPVIAMMETTKMAIIDKILICFTIFAVAFLVGLRVAWQPLPLQSIYKQYNHITVYEDGSFIAERWDGVFINSCIQGAPCND